MNRIYLDNAATTSIDPEVVSAMLPFLTESFGNPSSIYSYGRENRMAIESSRKSIAAVLNAHPSEIFFTSCGTESNNTAICGSVRDLGCTRIISSKIEHHAVTHTVEHYQKHENIHVEYVPVLASGHLDYEVLENMLSGSSEKTLVSLMHANNEIGVMLDIKRVGELCKKYDAYFHSDTVQTVGHFPIDLKNTHVHFITGAAHKFHGPKGVGLLYINKEIQIKPFLFGGGQERNMRAGTENVYGIVGLAKALTLATERYESDRKKIQELKNHMRALLKENISGVTFNGDDNEEGLYTVLSVNFPVSEKTEMLLFNLDIHHICASSGSACSSGADAGSHVLNELPSAKGMQTIRFSFSRHNSTSDIEIAVETLKKLLA
jgi:cysteine desulfurase